MLNMNLWSKNVDYRILPNLYTVFKLHQNLPNKDTRCDIRHIP